MGSTNQDGHQYKTKSFFILFLFFKSTNQELVEIGVGGGAGWGGVSISAFFISFRQYKIYRGTKIKRDGGKGGDEEMMEV